MVGLVSGVDVDDCVSDTETICGDADADVDVSTEASMPQLYFVSDLGSSSNSDAEDQSESDFDADADVGLSWGCKILPKNTSEAGKTSANKSMCRRFYSTDCNDVDNGASSNDDDDFERRSLPSNFVTSLVEDSSREIESIEQKSSGGSGLKRSPKCEIIDSSTVSSEAESSDNGTGSNLSWIDRTPSESSLQLPFCPPLRVDFEDFPKAFRPPSVTTRQQKQPTPTKQQPLAEESSADAADDGGNCDQKTSPSSLGTNCDENLSEKSSPEPERCRRSMVAPDREFSIIPVEKFSDFCRAIPSPAFPLLSPSASAASSQSFVSCREMICEAPPEFSDPETKSDSKRSHYVEIIIQISPPMAFSTPILPPPPSFSTTVTRPNLPHKSCAVSRYSGRPNGKVRETSIRSSMRDSGLADISPHICRRRHRRLSSSQSYINSASPTSGLSSDEIGASLTGLAATPTSGQTSRQNLNLRTGCCFLSRPLKSGKKYLPFSLLNKRAKVLRRERSQSLDDAAMLQTCRPNTGLENDGAISCLDLPVSSLSSDIFEDDEEPQERDSSYRSALYAHWWLNPVRKL